MRKGRKVYECFQGCKFIKNNSIYGKKDTASGLTSINVPIVLMWRNPGLALS